MRRKKIIKGSQVQRHGLWLRLRLVVSHRGGPGLWLCRRGSPGVHGSKRLVCQVGPHAITQSSVAQASHGSNLLLWPRRACYQAQIGGDERGCEIRGLGGRRLSVLGDGGRRCWGGGEEGRLLLEALLFHYPVTGNKTLVTRGVTN